MCCRFLLACYFPIYPFGLRSAIRSRDSLLSSLPAARAIQQCTSWRTGYYEASVAIGLASRRRSHVHNCRTYQRDLGVPLVSFNAPTGHRSCTPEDYRRYLVTLRQGPAPVPDVCPAGVAFAPSGDWASGNPAFAVSRGSPGTPPLTPEHGRRFPGMLLSPSLFRAQVSHQIQRHLLRSLPATRAIQQCATWRTQIRQ